MSWLRAEIERDEARLRNPTRVEEEERALSLLQPLTTEEAYAWFGTFLGLFPPFAIFCRLLRLGNTSDGAVFWMLLLLVMNAVCCLVGRKFGAYLGRRAGDPRGWSWPTFLSSSLFMGIAWGIVTGATGGAVGFGFGAFFGVACAVPVALVAFPVFMLLHRLLSHGGMIEERQLWPLAFGVPVCIAALILSQGIYPN
jgi:hypothetical protein